MSYVHSETLADFPLPLAVLDYETFYDVDYSLSKMTTEAYIRDPKFEIILLGIITPSGERHIITGTLAEIKAQVAVFPWGEWAVVCHNTPFDGAISSWILGIFPALWLDTLSMARAMQLRSSGNSLKALAEFYGLPAKGGYVTNMLGAHRHDMTPLMFKQYSEYCLLDCELTLEIFDRLWNGWYSFNPIDKRDRYPKQELVLIDVIIRMFTEPVFVLNTMKLQEHLEKVQAAKASLLEDCGAAMEDLQSSARFAELLNKLGVEAPRKISLITGKETFALAKTDQGMKDLLEHENEQVQALAAARLGVKSTLEESRTARFIAISRRGKFPVPLAYGKTRTHRLAGEDKINLHNLPSRGKNAKSIKKCIEVPPNHIAIDADSSNIEARGVAWLAEQNDLVQAFAEKRDVYCELATKIYGRTITKKELLERFVGKTVTLGCLAGDTKVLTDSGWKPIIEVSATDMLWDGLSWVTHHGLLKQGQKTVQSKWGLTATSDHEILTEHGWREWQEVQKNPSLIKSAIKLVNLPSFVGKNTRLNLVGTRGITPYVNVAAGGSVLCYAKTSKKDAVHGVIPALKEKAEQLKNCIGGMLTSYQTMLSEKVSLTASLIASVGVENQPTKIGRATVVEVLPCTQNGLMIGVNFYNTLLPSKDGIIYPLKWIGSTTTKGTSRETLDLLQEAKTWLTVGLSIDSNQKKQNYGKKKSPLKRSCETYDIALSGPNNRFTVLTNQGPILVHNCGYGTGALKLQITLKNADPPVVMTESECQNIINLYRDTYPRIPALWKNAEKALHWMVSGQQGWLGREGVVLVDGTKGLRLPNGMYIQYPELCKDAEGYKYKDGRKGWVRIYGAKLVENVVQALARIIVMWQLVKISRKYKVALTVHDAICIVVKQDEQEEASEFVSTVMKTAPKWAQGWPLDCEYGCGLSYGDC